MLGKLLVGPNFGGTTKGAFWKGFGFGCAGGGSVILSSSAGTFGSNLIVSVPASPEISSLRPSP